jgi:anti-anti-sigma factor
MASGPIPTLAVDHRGDVTIVQFAGAEILFEEAVNRDLGNQIYALVDQDNCRKLVVDFDGVRYISSSLIARLVGLYRRMDATKGQLILSRMGPYLRDTLKVSRLEQLFEFEDDLEAAVARLQSPA